MYLVQYNSIDYNHILLHNNEVESNITKGISLFYRAVALGLTAEDMMSVYEYQENLKEQKKVKEMETSTAEVIKREVVHQQMDAQVNTAVNCSQGHYIVSDWVHWENPKVNLCSQRKSQGYNMLTDKITKKSHSYCLFI